MQGNPLWPWRPMVRSCPGRSYTFSNLLINTTLLITTLLITIILLINTNLLITTTLLFTTTFTRGDMNGLLKRPASPTTSDSSKENMDEEDNNNMSGLTRYMRIMQ